MLCFPSPRPAPLLAHLSSIAPQKKGCDYLVFYKDTSHTSKWGKDKYTGRKGDACWKEALTIPSHTFVVHFYSDGSNTDWGWKFKCSFTQRHDVIPPSFPLDPLLLPRSHLKMVGAKALRSVLQSSEWFTRALARSHDLSTAVINAVLQPSSCLVLERELSRKCADVYLCSAAATGRTTTFTAQSEAALHSCVYAQQMLREGRRPSFLDAAAAAAAAGASAPGGVLAGGGPSQLSVPRSHAVPRVLRLSGVQRDGKEDHAANGFYLQDLARGGGSGVVYRKAGAAEAGAAAGKKAGPQKRGFNHYPASLEVGDLVRRGPDWSYGDQDKNGGLCCAGTVYLINGDVISVKWVANVADIGNSFHDNNYYYKPQKYDVYKLNPENLGAYPPGEAPPVAPADDAVVAGGGSGAAASAEASLSGAPSVIIANVTGASEAKINGTYHWNAAENHYEKLDKSMIIEYRVKKWQIKSYGKKGQNAAFASMEADSDAISIWESKAPLVVAKGEEWLPQPQATVTRGPSSPGAAQYLEFVVTNQATGAGRWVVNEASQLGTTAGKLYCEASSASLPMDPACCWVLRTLDDPLSAGESLKGVRAVCLAFPVESKPARGDFLAPVDVLSSADVGSAETQSALVSKKDHIPTSFELSGYTGALAEEVNGVWDLVPPHDKRRSEPQQQVLTKRGQPLSIVYCPAVGKQAGCGPDCSESHSNSTCFSCGEGWGSHSGHSCTNNRGRGSFPSASAPMKMDPQSRKFKIVRIGAGGGGKPLAELSVEAVLDAEGRLRIATPVAPAAAAVPEKKPALNRAGVLMKPGSSSGTKVFYCGRQLGRDIVGQDSDGQCGPNNGPQCPDCRGASELALLTTTAWPPAPVG